MKTAFVLIITYVLAFGEVEVSGHLDLEREAFLIAPDSKHKNSFTLKQTLEFVYAYEDLSGLLKVYAQEDYYDTLQMSEHTKRSFARVDELYVKYDFEDDSLQAGKTIKYWGALELMNIVDVFNPKDLRSDMLNPDKLGVWNLSYSHFTDEGEFCVIMKLDEPDQKMAESSYVYNFLPQFIEYDASLQTSNGVNYPSIYLSYSASSDGEYALDYAFILERGYDSQRYLNSSVVNPLLLNQNAYLVNKFMSYNTLVVDATLIKLEVLYADVVADETVGDYSHVAFGFEHTMENIYKSAGFGIIFEYYRYDSYESDKYDDLDLYETMQNDMFIGARYSFNNADDSSIVGGVVHDLDYNEQTYYTQYESRVFESLKVRLDYYYIEPSKTTHTAYAVLGRHQRVGLNIAYYF